MTRVGISARFDARASTRCLGGARRGFTLLEFVTALGVFVVGLGVLVRMHLVAVAGVELADEIAFASRLASSKLEQLAVAPFDALLSGSEARGSLGRRDTQAPVYVVTWNVSRGELKTLDVVVSWARGTSQRRVALATQRAR